MNARKRLTPDDSKAEILEAAARVAIREGLCNMTRDHVMAEADRSAGLVSRAFGGMDGLKAAVIRAAIEHNVAEIIADGLAMRDPIAQGAPEALLRKARAILSKR